MARQSSIWHAGGDHGAHGGEGAGEIELVEHGAEDGHAEFDESEKRLPVRVRRKQDDADGEDAAPTTQRYQ